MSKQEYQWKKVMSGKDVIAMLKKNGWLIASIVGDHYKLKKNGFSCVVPFHTELKKGTYSEIKKCVALVEKKSNL
jgi:predicted RNA binding protein YcfA (HicA-like mRNA interferase family)